MVEMPVSTIGNLVLSGPGFHDGVDFGGTRRLKLLAAGGEMCEEHSKVKDCSGR
jgi:hypothetical protein